MSYDVLVIGGGPAGMSAALNARARGKRVLVVSNPLEENPLWRSKLVDNHLGMPRISGAEMLTSFRRHAEAAGAEFRTGKVLSTVRMGDDCMSASAATWSTPGPWSWRQVWPVGGNFPAKQNSWAGASATAPPAMGCSTGERA